jgi:hypothetical protein
MLTHIDFRVHRSPPVNFHVSSNMLVRHVGSDSGHFMTKLRLLQSHEDYHLNQPFFALLVHIDNLVDVADTPVLWL